MRGFLTKTIVLIFNMFFLIVSAQEAQIESYLGSIPLEYYVETGLLKETSPRRFYEVFDPSWTSEEYSLVASESTTYTIDLRNATQVSNQSIILENIGSVNIINPWLVINSRKDWYSTESILDEVLKDEEDPKKRAFRIWEFIKLNRYHWYPAEAGEEIHCPTKFLNVYGCGFCDDCASNLEALSKSAGFSQARCWGLSGHVVPEVYYNSAWHMLDPDLKVFYPARDNITIASVEECAADGWLVRRVSGPGIEELYTTTVDNSTYQNRWNTLHTMAITLRPGESLERCWYNWGKYHDNYLRQEPPRYGNGRIVYSPNFRNNIFKSGFQQLQNVETFEDSSTTPNVHLANSSMPGIMRIKMTSPYVFVGGLLQLDYLTSAATEQIIVEFSKNGVSWTQLGQLTGPSSGMLEWSLDGMIAPLDSSACYAFWLRIMMAGNEETAVGLSEMKITGDVQFATVSLPALGALKTNTCSLRMTCDSGGQLQISHLYEWRNYISPPEASRSAISPEDGSLISTLDTTLSWESELTSSTLYQHEIIVSLDEEGILPVSPPLWQWIDESCSWDVPDGWLLPSRAYFWKVRARDMLGMWGDWSEPWAFAIEDISRVKDWVFY